MTKVKNAIIESTYLGLEDHGIPTCFLNLSFEHCAQSFGGYDLRHFGIDMIFMLIETIEAKSWEDLKGKHCRIKENNGRLIEIGHIIKDKWYTVK